MRLGACLAAVFRFGVPSRADLVAAVLPVPSGDVVLGGHRSFIPPDDSLGLLPVPWWPRGDAAVVGFFPALVAERSLLPCSHFSTLFPPYPSCYRPASPSYALNLCVRPRVLLRLLVALPGAYSGVRCLVAVFPVVPSVMGVSVSLGPVSAFQVLGMGLVNHCVMVVCCGTFCTCALHYCAAVGGLPQSGHD